VNLSCTWAGEDGVVDAIDPGNCWRPEIWFLPPLSLQPSLLPSYLGALDLGTITVDFGAATYRHLQAQLVLPDLATILEAPIMQRSTARSGPRSRLPAARLQHRDNTLQQRCAETVDGTLHQQVARIGSEGVEVGRIAGIGQQIEIDHADAGRFYFWNRALQRPPLTSSDSDSTTHQGWP
jgi:hypothetical protein